MKKIIALFLALIIGASIFVVNAFAYAPGTNDSVMPCNNHTLSTKTEFDIDTNGLAEISVKYTGYNGITSGGVITTKLQKRNTIGTWADVDIGTENNVWVAESNNVIFYTTYSFQLKKRGIYRVIVEYRISGNLGDDDVIISNIEQAY